MESAFGGAAGDDSVSGGDGAAAGGGAEDQEFPDQVAAGAAADSAAGDDGVADHAAVAGISEDCARRIHAAAGRETAFAHGDFEIFEAVCAASTASAAAAAARTRTESGGGCAGSSSCRREKRRSGEGKGRAAAAAAAVAAPAAPPPCEGEIRRRHRRRSKAQGKPAKQAETCEDRCESASPAGNILRHRRNRLTSRSQRQRARSGKMFPGGFLHGQCPDSPSDSTKFLACPASIGHIMGVCIDRFSLRRSCCCWRLCRFRRSMAVEAMRPVVAGMPGLLRTVAGSPATRALRLSAAHARVLVLRRASCRALAPLRVRHSPRGASTGATSAFRRSCAIRGLRRRRQLLLLRLRMRGCYGYPWGYAGCYDPYWWWDSGSSLRLWTSNTRLAWPTR